MQLSKPLSTIAFLLLATLGQTAIAEDSAPKVTFGDLWPLTCPLGVQKITSNEFVKNIDSVSPIDKDKVCTCISGKMKADTHIAQIFDDDVNKFEAFINANNAGKDYFNAKTYAFTMSCAAEEVEKAADVVINTKQ